MTLNESFLIPTLFSALCEGCQIVKVSTVWVAVIIYGAYEKKKKSWPLLSFVNTPKPETNQKNLSLCLPMPSEPVGSKTGYSVYRHTGKCGHCLKQEKTESNLKLQ